MARPGLLPGEYAAAGPPAHLAQDGLGAPITGIRQAADAAAMTSAVSRSCCAPATSSSLRKRCAIRSTAGSPSRLPCSAGSTMTLPGRSHTGRVTASASGTTASHWIRCPFLTAAAANAAPSLRTDSMRFWAPDEPNGDSAPAIFTSSLSASPDTGSPLAPSGWAGAPRPACPGSTIGLSSTTDLTGTPGCLASIA